VRDRSRTLGRLLRHDRALGATLVAGADEAGRGAIAGPLFAAGVLLEPDALTRRSRKALAYLDDSKRLTPRMREELLPHVLAVARRVTVVAVPVPSIDDGGVHRANLAALARALGNLDAPEGTPHLVDGFRLPGLARAHTAIVDGDEKSAAIAAASIVAKVMRDRTMGALGLVHPVYGFEQHAGYGTPAHLAALRVHGPCAAHRRSFAPCAQLELLTI
jgi:ribonuclease HII